MCTVIHWLTEWTRLLGPFSDVAVHVFDIFDCHDFQHVQAPAGFRCIARVPATFMRGFHIFRGFYCTGVWHCRGLFCVVFF